MLDVLGVPCRNIESKIEWYSHIVVNSPSKKVNQDFAAAFLHGLLPTVYIRCYCQ